MKFRNFFIFLIAVYFLLIIFKISLFKYTFSEFRGWSEDGFLWSYCALELSKKKNPDLIPNFHFQVGYVSNLEIPAYLVGFLSPIFTLILFIFFKIFKSVYPFHIFLFFISLLDFYLIYKILKAFSISEESKIYALASIFFSPLFLIFSFKLRPDALALFFSLLSILFILRKKFIISSILFSISVFGFKIQSIIWIFFLLYLIRQVKGILLFLVFFSFSFIIWFYFFYLPISSKYPLLITYLLYSNTISVFDLKRLFLNQNYLISLAQIIGIFHIYGILYLLGCFQYIFYLRISEIIPPRSFNSIILNFSFAHIYHKLTKFKNILKFILLFQITLNILFFLFDLRINLDNDRFYRKLERITRNENIKVCSYLRQSNFYLYLFHPNRENLIHFFSRRLSNYKNCDVMTYHDMFRKTIIYKDSIFDFNFKLPFNFFKTW